LSKNKALLVIDVQAGLIDGPKRAFQGNEVLAQIGLLLGKARGAGAAVIYIQHDGAESHPLRVSSPWWEIHPAIAPAEGETVIHKRASDSFYETSLKAELDARGIEQLVVVGCMTDYCVDTTSRRAISLGYDVELVKDAHTTWDSEILTAAQIIAHHNDTLDGFGNDQHVIDVRSAREIEF
jgi:nicotinamidase-related amidase